MRVDLRSWFYLAVAVWAVLAWCATSLASEKGVPSPADFPKTERCRDGYGVIDLDDGRYLMPLVRSASYKFAEQKVIPSHELFYSPSFCFIPLSKPLTGTVYGFAPQSLLPNVSMSCDLFGEAQGRFPFRLQWHAELCAEIEADQKLRLSQRMITTDFPLLFAMGRKIRFDDIRRHKKLSKSTGETSALSIIPYDDNSVLILPKSGSFEYWFMCTNRAAPPLNKDAQSCRFFSVGDQRLITAEVAILKGDEQRLSEYARKVLDIAEESKDAVKDFVK